MLNILNQLFYLLKKLTKYLTLKLIIRTIINIGNNKSRRVDSSSTLL